MKVALGNNFKDKMEMFWFNGKGWSREIWEAILQMVDIGSYLGRWRWIEVQDFKRQQNPRFMCFLFREIRFSFVFFCLHDFWVADGGAQAQQNQFVGDHFLPDIWIFLLNIADLFKIIFTINDD